MPPVPGEESVRRLAEALVGRLGASSVCWVGSPGPGVDAIGWRLCAVPRFLFSVSTHAGELPLEQYDFQVSVADNSLDNGEIVFLDILSLDLLCSVVERFAAGDVVKRVG
jgi:hypothetical protein